MGLPTSKNEDTDTPKLLGGIPPTNVPPEEVKSDESTEDMLKLPVDETTPLQGAVAAEPADDQGCLPSWFRDFMFPRPDAAETKEQAREREWTQTRFWGFASFIFPASIMIVLSMRNDVAEVVYEEKSYDWADLIEKTMLYIGAWILKDIVLNCFKWWWFTQFWGLSREHFDLLIGPRHEWTDKEVNTLVQAYGKWNLKVMDAVNRRAGHVVINIIRIWYFTSFLTNYQFRLHSAMLQLPIINGIKIFTESGECCWDVGKYIFQGARLFDGRYGRFNLVVVNFWAYAGRVVMFELLIQETSMGDEVSGLLFMLAMQSLLWGDSAGELIGSFWGKHRFKVMGLGDVNEKSIEGTLAVFVASFLGMLGVFYGMYGEEVSSVFIYHPVLVLAYTCVVATIAEVAAPRGTDNFFLQVLSLLVLMASIKEGPTTSQ